MDFDEQNEIENANLVFDHFGYWPSFHDSEIISLTFERTIDMGSSSVLLKVYSFEITDKVVNGSYQLTKHCLVDIEIVDLMRSKVKGFNHQNALLAIEFGRKEANLFCNLVSAFGVDGYMEGKKVRIKRLDPIDEEHLLVKY